MTESKICTCPSGNGSLRHPCPAHPASVEQAGGDERVIGWRERILAAHPNSDPGFWPDALLVEHMAAEIADLRAALAQPSPVRSSLLINGYQLRAALDFIAPDGTAEQLKSEACIEWRQQDADFLEAGLYAFCAEYPEEGGVLLDEEPTTAQPSPLQSEQAEAERPEVVAWRYGFSGGIVSDKACLDEWKSGGEYQSLMTVAQHERIVAFRWERAMDLMGEHVARISEKFKAERDAALAEVERLRQSKGDPSGSFDRCMKMMYERDENAKQLEVALARVAELEKQEPVATIAKVPGEDWNGLHFYRDLQGMQPGTKLYAAPVAQAQQLHDMDKQCRDDVARALGLRPSQERGFAWSYLLASIKSCVKASEDAAQAQHSVPEGWYYDAPSQVEAVIIDIRGMWGEDDCPTYEDVASALRRLLAAAPGCHLSRNALTEAQMRRLYDSSTETENERLGFAAFARLIRRAEAVHQIAAAPGKEGL